MAAVERSLPDPAAPIDILDLASGPGQPSMLMAETLPASRITCTDFAPDMVEKARSNVMQSGLTDRIVSAIEADMCDMPQVADASADVVTVSYGLMFAPELPKAMSEIERVLRPGGFMAATVWNDLPIMGLVKDLMTRVLGHAPPPPPINPLSLSDASLLDGEIARAGLKLTHQETGIVPINVGADPDEQWQLGTFVVRPQLTELHEKGEHGDVWATARSAFFELSEAQWGGLNEKGELEAPPNEYRLVIAHKPE